MALRLRHRHVLLLLLHRLRPRRRQSDRKWSDQGGNGWHCPGIPDAEGVARRPGTRGHRLRLSLHLGAARDPGHAEVAAGRERDDENGVQGQHRGHHLPLPWVQVLRLRRVRRRHPGNLLTGFDFYEPYWLIDLANLSVVLHLLGVYQVYSQPAFALAERRFGTEACVFDVELPLLGRRRVDLFRLCYRTAYVAATTTVAVWFPYFNQVVGLIGAFSFWPKVIHFPVEMYIVQAKVVPWTARWLAIRAFSGACLLVCVFAFVGSAMGVLGSKRS